MASRFHKTIFNRYLNPGEYIVYITHNHFISIAKNISLDIFFWILIPTFLAYNQILTPYIYYLYPLAALIITYHLYDWYGDALVLTNKSIINIEWNGIFDKKSERVNLSDVATVNAVHRGFMSTIFRFGKLVIKCSNGTNIKIKYAKSPEKAQATILGQREQNESEEKSIAQAPTSQVRNIERRRPTNAEKKGFMKYEVIEDMTPEEL